ncbi:NAD(P)H-hydrate dehydratase [bacterium]|nr:NAD(P)H-hydrate dehydratase [bacterium]
MPILKNSPALWKTHFPWPRDDAHKYSRGTLFIMAGKGAAGAPLLAAEAAMRAAAGYVMLACPKQHHAMMAAMGPRALVYAPYEAPAEWQEALSSRPFTALLIGPGNGVSDHTKTQLRTLMEQGLPMVVDADGLTCLAGQAGMMKDVAHAPLVLTPHEGEFARLFKDISGDRPHRAMAAAKASGAVVVLKGPDTLIASPSGELAVQEHAPAWLATAGSGDVLVGIIAGLLSTMPASGISAFHAACAGVWLHSEAARLHGPGLIADDLPPILPDVLAYLQEEA